MGRLSGKVAMITGGARGMGAATARLFVAEDARVAISDIADGPGDALAAELEHAARFYRHDVTDPASWAATVSAVEMSLGPIDILVNNAGILFVRELLETEPNDFRRVIDVNLVGALLGIQAVAPGMIARRRGAIVNVSSVDGMKGSNGLAAYAASKWGLRGLTRVAALELGHRGVRVNSVHPGGIDTPMVNHDGVARDVLDERFRDIALQRIGAPDEIARTTLFLASDEASYLCGSEIVVDGGMLAGGYYAELPGAPKA